MRPDGLTIVSGGVPTVLQMAALAGALTVLLEQERAAPADPIPAVYRSPWRRAAIVGGVR